MPGDQKLYKGERQQGRWTNEEHEAFLQSFAKYRMINSSNIPEIMKTTNWKAIAEAVGTRNVPQTRQHAQKHFRSIWKKRKKPKSNVETQGRDPTDIYRKLSNTEIEEAFSNEDSMDKNLKIIIEAPEWPSTENIQSETSVYVATTTTWVPENIIVQEEPKAIEAVWEAVDPLDSIDDTDLELPDSLDFSLPDSFVDCDFPQEVFLFPTAEELKNL